MNRLATQTRRRGNGFTLIEILVALAIAATVIVPILYLFSQTVDTEEATRFYTLAPLLASSKIAEVRSGIIRGNSSSGSFDQYPGYGWQLDIEDSAGIFSTLGEAARDLKQVKVAVYLDDSKERYYRLLSYEFLP